MAAAARRPDSPEAIAAREKAAERKARHERSKRIAEKRKAAAVPVVLPERSDVATDIAVPTPPFWGSRIVKGISLSEYSGLLDERALFLGQWGLRGQRKGDGPTYEELVESEGRPRLRYWLDRLTSEGILAHAAVVYGYFPAISEGDDVIVLTEPKPDAPERFRFTYPRQHRDRFLCIADFVRSRKEAEATGQVDVLPFPVGDDGSADRGLSPTSCSHRTRTAITSRFTESVSSSRSLWPSTGIDASVKS